MPLSKHPARGFTISFGVIDITFSTNLEQRVAINIFDFAFANILERRIAIDIFDFAFAINWSGGSPSMKYVTSTASMSFTSST
jgi:hypothetical protein